MFDPYLEILTVHLPAFGTGLAIPEVLSCDPIMTIL